MGWKAACILVNEREPGYLGTLPTHHSQAARDLADQLGLGSYRRLGLTVFNAGIYPEDGHLVIGAYDGAAIVASQDLIFGAATGENTRVLRRLLDLFPAAELLVMELHSVVNYWAYAYYRAGELQRAYAGSADDGVLVETGEVQPEERDYFVHSVVQHGVRTFTRHGETWTADQMGESLTLSMAGRFVGESLDEADEILYLTVEEFAEPSS
jgi:uncharacterized protein DUF6928